MTELTLGGEPCRLIPGYPDYAVSASGRVWSLKYGKIKELVQYKRERGYLDVNVAIQGKTRTHAKVRVHRLVAAAWIGPCPEGYEINHKNRNTSDNEADNLEYVTHAENVAHAVNLGAWKGENNGQAKLTEQDVMDIRAMYKKGGWTYESLAEVFSTPSRTVCGGTIKNVITRQTWRHLP